MDPMEHVIHSYGTGFFQRLETFYPHETTPERETASCDDNIPILNFVSWINIPI